MASFVSVNYSLRPSKSIQRLLMFEGIRTLQLAAALEEMVYIGLGSIWFTDFVVAHKVLNIDDMISIEKHDVGYRRAVFNAPYATVKVIQGHTSTILPTLFVDEALRARPWLIWLDFDTEFSETLADDVRSALERAPDNTILLITFNGADSRYGHADERTALLRELFGDVVPDTLSKRQCRGERMENTLANLALDFMKSAAIDSARPGNFIPAFRALYKDTSPMVTVGGIIASAQHAQAFEGAVNHPNWRCRPVERIVAPHLTLREATTLQSALPRQGGLTREVVRALQFDLEDEQITAFEMYYKEYPAFVQIVS